MGGGEAEDHGAVLAALRFVNRHGPRRKEVGEDFRLRVLDGFLVEGDGGDVRVDGCDDA